MDIWNIIYAYSDAIVFYVIDNPSIAFTLFFVMIDKYFTYIKKFTSAFIVDCFVAVNIFFDHFFYVTHNLSYEILPLEFLGNFSITCSLNKVGLIPNSERIKFFISFFVMVSISFVPSWKIISCSLRSLQAHAHPLLRSKSLCLSDLFVSH